MRKQKTATETGLAAKRWASNKYMERTSQSSCRRATNDSDSCTFIVRQPNVGTNYMHHRITAQVEFIFHRNRLIIIIIFPFCMGLTVWASVRVHRRFDTNTDIQWWKWCVRASQSMDRQVTGRSTELRIVFLAVSSGEFGSNEMLFTACGQDGEVCVEVDCCYHRTE